MGVFIMILNNSQEESLFGTSMSPVFFSDEEYKKSRGNNFTFEENVDKDELKKSILDLLKEHQANPPYPGAEFDEQKHRWVAPKEKQTTDQKDKKTAKPKKENGKLAIPPNWHDVWINPDKTAPILVTARDEAGRKVYIRSKEYSEAKAAEKFARLRDFSQAVPAIMKQIRKDKSNKEEAAILFIISQTGFRVGSEKNTKAKVKAYGISTLEGRHVKVNGDNVEFDFIGKEGIRNYKTVRSKELAEIISQHKKGDNEKMFKVPGSKALSYLQQISGRPFKVKDFRTYIATNIALEAVKGMPIPTTAKEFKSYKAKVAKKVSEELCNTPDMALKAYIAPEVFTPWISQLQKEGIMKEYSDINDLFGEVFYDEYGNWEEEDDDDDDDEDDEEEKGKKPWRKDDEVEQPSADVVWDGTKTPKLSLLQDYLNKANRAGLIPVKRQAKNKFGTVYTIIRYIDPETGKQHFPGKWKGGVQGKEEPNYDLESEGRANAAEEAGTGARAEYGPTGKPWTTEYGVKVEDTQKGTKYSNKDLTIEFINTGANFLIRENGKLKGSVPREKDAVKYTQKRFAEVSKKIKKGEDGALQMGSEGQENDEPRENKEGVLLGFPGAEGKGEEVEEEKEGNREMLCVKEGDTGKLSIDEHLFLLGVKKQEDIESIKTYGEWMHLKKSLDDSFIHSDIRIKVDGSDSVFGFSSALINSGDRNKLVEPAKKERIFVSSFQQPMSSYDWMNRIGRDEAWVLKMQDDCSMVYKLETEADVIFKRVEDKLIEMEITNTQKIPEGKWKLSCMPLNKEDKWVLSYQER